MVILLYSARETITLHRLQKIMPLYHILLLAIIQGVTEFLPISSSGHLVLFHHLAGEGSVDLCWDQNRLMDVAVHVGTLLSVLLYFHKDIFMMLTGVTQKSSNGFYMVRNLIIASVPVIIFGFILQMFQFSFLCLLEVMAWMMLIFGIVLMIADRFEEGGTLEKMGIKHALWIGLSQMLALIPGVSRSGITMTSARFLGYSRVESARFSLLLSIVAISGAGTLTGLDLFEEKAIILNMELFLAVLFSFIAGWVSIALMMKWLSRASFKPFGIYRIILGILLLGLLYGGVL